jgi:hypothetical protein
MEITEAQTYIATAYRAGKRGWREIHDEGGITPELIAEYGTPAEYLDAWSDDKIDELQWRTGEYRTALYRQGADTLAAGDPVAELEFDI